MGKKNKNRLDSNIKNKKDVEWEKKEWFITSLIILSGMLILWLLRYLSQSGSEDYFEVNNSIFLASLLIIVLFMFSSRLREKVYEAYKKILLSKEKTDYIEKSYFVFGLASIISIISFLLVDYSFINNYGIKIGAVLAIKFVEIIRLKIKGQL